MIIQSAKYITERLISDKYIEYEKKNIYQYGLEVIISTTLNILLLLLIGLVTQTVVISVCYFLILATVRTQTGGYHASTYFKCEMLGCTVYIMVVWCIKKVVHFENISHQTITIVLMVIMLLIIIFSLITTQVVGKTERKRLKKKIISREMIWFGCAIVFRNKN